MSDAQNNRSTRDGQPPGGIDSVKNGTLTPVPPSRRNTRLYFFIGYPLLLVIAATLVLLWIIKVPINRFRLATRNDRISELRQQGKLAETEQEYRALLEDQIRQLGPEDTQTLNTRNNLACALHEQRNYAGAEQEHRAVLAARQRVFGLEHLDVAQSRSNLANTLRAQGKHAEAEQELHAVLAIQENHLGPENPDTLKTRNKLAGALAQQDKPIEAEQEYRALLAITERVLGPEDADVFRISFNLAVTLKVQKKWKEALVYAVRADDGWKKTAGNEHPNSRKAKELREEIEVKLQTQ